MFKDVSIIICVYVESASRYDCIGHRIHDLINLIDLKNTFYYYYFIIKY